MKSFANLKTEVYLKLKEKKSESVFEHRSWISETMKWDIGRICGMTKGWPEAWFLQMKSECMGKEPYQQKAIIWDWLKNGHVK